MESHDVIIEITPDGKVHATVQGAKGKACLEYAKLLESIVGKQVSQELTTEYYEPETMAAIDVASHIQLGQR